MEIEAKKEGIVYNKPSVESWTLSGVSHRGKSGTYELLGEMTPSMNQDNLVQKYGLEIPGADLIWAIASRGYELRKENPEASETLRQFLKKGMRQYPNTSTRIFYEPQGKDRIVSNYNTADQYSNYAEVVGEDDWMENLKDKKVLEHLLGTSNVSQINEVSQWVNGTNSYLWRLNSKPKQKDERVVGFWALGDGLYLGCGRYPQNEYPAFRVLKAE